MQLVLPPLDTEKTSETATVTSQMSDTANDEISKTATHQTPQIATTSKKLDVPDLPNQTAFKRLSMNERSMSRNNLLYETWVTYKNAEKRKHLSSGFSRFQDTNMDKFLSKDYVLVF